MTDYIAWSDDYLRQSENIRRYIKDIKLKLPDLSNIDLREEKRHIAMLYEISYELQCTAKRLRRGRKNDYKLSS